MRLETFAQILAVLESVYGQTFEDKLRMVWWWALRDLGDNAAKYALKVVVQHVRFLPKPADLFLRAQEYVSPPPPVFDGPALGPGEETLAPSEVAQKYIDEIREMLAKASGPLARDLEQIEIPTLNESDVARLRANEEKPQ